VIWSISDSKTFRRCQRQWFYKKLGNAKASDPLRRQLYLLSKLQSISAWRGQIVDSVISEIVIPAVTAKRPITLEQAKARASQLFNLQLACARKHELMSPGFSPSQLGSSFAAFHAMEYGGSVREQEIETAADEINRALTHLFSMTDLKALLKSAERLIPQRALIFDHSGVSVRAVPDLIAFFGDNPPVIVDWKVHVFGIDEAWLQLAAYSLALTRCNPHKDFPSTVKSFSATQIELVEVQLLTNCVRRYSLSDEEVATAEAYIAESTTEMLLSLQDQKLNQLSADEFSVAKYPGTCQSCQFRSVCWGGQA
jgi:CRISPR/Cas system-associated exonuclease Cas4 (RecB family)